MQGREPITTRETNNQRQLKGLENGKIIDKSFHTPASCPAQRKELLTCLTQEHGNYKGKGPKANWAKITNDYNVRADIPMRVTQHTLKKEYETYREVQQSTHSNGTHVPFASPPRRITWADIGGRKQHITREPETPTRSIARSIRETVYYAAYRILRKQEIIANKETARAHAPTYAPSLTTAPSQVLVDPPRWKE